MEPIMELEGLPQIAAFLKETLHTLSDAYEFSYDCGTRFFHYKVQSHYTYDFFLKFFQLPEGCCGIYSNERDKHYLQVYEDQWAANEIYCDIVQSLSETYPNFIHIEVEELLEKE